MQNIKSGTIEKKWKIPLDKIMIDLDSIRELLDESYRNGQAVKNLNLEIPKGTDGILSQHSILLKDGSILFKASPFGYIYKIDENSKILWKSKKLANHAIELDENGNIWTGVYNLTNVTANKLGYNEDAILCLDQEGNELYFKSLTDIYLENGLFESTVESTPVGYSWDFTYKDPLHLNDVEPVMKDGTFWKKGDVFISMRNKSLVALFRPETGKIIMQRQGPWLMQHDIDIENDSIISIFNNNVSSLNDEVKTSSNIALYNFKTNRTKFILNDIFRTKFQGRKTRLRSKDIFIESTMTGLYYMLDSIGNFKYNFYVPYPPDPNFAQIPGWSRVYLKENGTFIEE
jgi:outer membrane protein assembly factor BamB